MSNNDDDDIDSETSKLEELELSEEDTEDIDINIEENYNIYTEELPRKLVMKPTINELMGILLKLENLLDNNTYVTIDENKFFELYNVKLYDNHEKLNTLTIAMITMILYETNIVVGKNKDMQHVKRYGEIVIDNNTILYYQIIKLLIESVSELLKMDILNKMFPELLNCDMVDESIIQHIINVKTKLILNG